MNHISYRKYGLIIVSMIGLCLFNACDDDEDNGIFGNTTSSDESQKVYLSNGVAPMNFMDMVVQFSPSEIPDKVEYKVPVRITSPSSTDITVTLEMADLEAVTTYNTVHGTNYELPVEGTYEFTKNTATIKAGQYVSEDFACLTLSNFKAMNLYGKYLFPVKLKEVSDDKVALSTNMNQMYCALINNCINVDPGESELGDGQFIVDRDWYINSTPYSYDCGYLIDGKDANVDKYDKWLVSGQNFALVFNFKKEVTFNGISMGTTTAYSGEANVKNVDIYTSENNIDWKLIGSKLFPKPSKIKNNIVKFYIPITTQYLKLYFPDSWYYTSSYGGEYTLGISEFNLIEWPE